MWNGPVTDELKRLCKEYMDKFGGEWPHGYDDVDYDDMTYDEFIGYIKKSLKTGRKLPYVLDPEPRCLVFFRAITSLLRSFFRSISFK